MAINFFTDPHLGLNRQAHTTDASRRRLRAAMYRSVEGLLDRSPLYCLGDLFDTWANDEATLVQGYAVAQRCEKVLAGNHDLPNREGRTSSLQMLAEIDELRDVIVVARVDELGFCPVATDEGRLVFVPHHASQGMFEQAIREAAGYVASNPVRSGGPAEYNVLCLHCNYDLSFESTDSTLNLPRNMAKELLEVFDFILLGHEHVARKDFDGRVQILGNTHPTSFSDISDKYVWTLEEGVLTPRKIWEESGNVLRLEWQDLLTNFETNYAGEQFIEIVGSAPAEKAPDISRAVVRAWAGCSEAMMIRNAVQIEALQTGAVDAAAFKAMNMVDRVGAELRDTRLKPLWDTYLERLSC